MRLEAIKLAVLPEGHQCGSGRATLAHATGTYRQNDTPRYSRKCHTVTIRKDHSKIATNADINCTGHDWQVAAVIRCDGSP